jgi:mannose/fructose/N-acetylgalactosamine-specific phosphotransferase system component IIB
MTEAKKTIKTIKTVKKVVKKDVKCIVLKNITCSTGFKTKNKEILLSEEDFSYFEKLKAVKKI